jgi:hypothetical protein
MRIELKQELLDPEMAPVYGTCACCLREIYSAREYEEHGGLCEECWCALNDDEEDMEVLNG